MNVHVANRPLRVLVVDDSADTRDTTALLLRLWGHDASVAEDGTTALDVFATFGPDVVLLDLGLPGMDGFEVARSLRRMPSPRRPLVVSLSGYAGEEYRQRAIEAGCDLYWIKPAAPAALEELLQAQKAACSPRRKTPA